MKSAFPSLLEGDDSPANLNPLLDPGNLQEQVVLLDQRPEFALIVKHEILVPHFVDSGVVSRHADIGDPDFTLMPPSDFDPIAGYVLDHHHIIGLLGNTLQHQVLPRWLLYGHQLILDAVLLDETRVLFLADLAVKLLEVVLDGAPHHLFLYLRLVPLL